MQASFCTHLLHYCIALIFSIRGRFYSGIYHYLIKNFINNILVKIMVEMFGGFAEILYLCKQERQESPDLDFV